MSPVKNIPTSRENWFKSQSGGDKVLELINDITRIRESDFGIDIHFTSFGDTVTLALWSITMREELSVQLADSIIARLDIQQHSLVDISGLEAYLTSAKKEIDALEIEFIDKLQQIRDTAIDSVIDECNEFPEYHILKNYSASTILKQIDPIAYQETVNDIRETVYADLDFLKENSVIKLKK